MSTTAVTIQAALRAALESSQQVLEATMADVSDELANQPAPGIANSIGATYAHAVIAEDAMVNAFLQGKPPLLATTWAGRIGADRMPPREPMGAAVDEWFRTVRVDLPALREYAKAAHANALEFIEKADDATLAREVDSPLGKMSAVALFAMVTLNHLNNHCGEIAALKGAAGQKGYPF